MPRTRTKPLALLAMLACGLSVTACHTVTVSGALNCAALIGPTLRADVPPADLPAENTVGDWVAFGDAQTAKLEDANGRRAAVVEVADRCQSEAERLTRRPWWRVFG